MSGMAFEVPPLQRADLRRLTTEIRQSIRQEKPWFPIVEFAELVLPKAIPDFTFLIGDYQEMGSNHGLTFPDENTIQIRADVYDRAITGKGRDRLTIAHEIGHLLLHKNIGLARKESPHDAVPTYCDSEWQANAFAGELLIYHKLVGNYKSIRNIAEAFGVSEKAAETQVKAFIRQGILRENWQA